MGEAERSRPTVQCSRLLCGDAKLGREAIGRVKIGGSKPWPSLEFMRAFLADRDHILIVATEGEQPIGFALAYLLDRVDGGRRMALFYEIEVAEAHRRCGAGRRMVETLKSVCSAEGVGKMWVQTSPSNDAAVALYRSTGARAKGNEGDTVFAYSFEGSGGRQPSKEAGCRPSSG